MTFGLSEYSNVLANRANKTVDEGPPRKWRTYAGAQNDEKDAKKKV